MQAFVKRNLTTRVIRQGFLHSKLVRNFKTFYSRYVTIIDKYGTSLSRNISDGICNGLPALYKHVTTRCVLCWPLGLLSQTSHHFISLSLKSRTAHYGMTVYVAALLLGHYDSEKGLGEWVEFTDSQRFL
jgi:hypothetical protein